MKKFYGIIVAILLCVLLAFAGCGGIGSTKVFNYVKTQQNFVGNPHYNGGNYTVSFTVNDDLSYSLSVSDMSGNYDALKDYSFEGAQMEYLGCRKESHESTSWGITTHWTNYIHVVKLPEATVEINGNLRAFYLLAESDSKYDDTFFLKLVVANSTYDESDISNIGTSFSDGYAIKTAE